MSEKEKNQPNVIDLQKAYNTELKDFRKELIKMTKFTAISLVGLLAIAGSIFIWLTGNTMGSLNELAEKELQRKQEGILNTVSDRIDEMILVALEEKDIDGRIQSISEEKVEVVIDSLVRSRLDEKYIGVINKIEILEKRVGEFSLEIQKLESSLSSANAEYEEFLNSVNIPPENVRFVVFETYARMGCEEAFDSISVWRDTYKETGRFPIANRMYKYLSHAALDPSTGKKNYSDLQIGYQFGLSKDIYFFQNP